MSNEDVVIPSARRAVLEYLIEKVTDSQRIYVTASDEATTYIRKLGDELKLDASQYTFNTDTLSFDRKEPETKVPENKELEGSLSS